MKKATFNVLPESEYSITESLNALKTNLQFCGENIQSLVFTSSIPNEGKSFITFNLANALAQDGKKVILLDLDLRKSVLLGRHKVHLTEELVGASHYLTAQAGIDDIIYETNIPGMDIIFAGPAVPNPTTLLSSEYLKQLLEELRKRYDMILVDVPPVGTVIDAAIVAPLCDGVVLVIGSKMTNRKYAIECKKQLEMAGAKLLGVVLNKIEETDSSYYSKHYYYKYSGYGYGKTKASKKS